MTLPQLLIWSQQLFSPQLSVPLTARLRSHLPTPMSCPAPHLLPQAPSQTCVNLKSLSSASGIVLQSNLLLLFPILLLTLLYISGGFLLHGVCSRRGKSCESRREGVPALCFSAPIHGLEEPELQLKQKSYLPLGCLVCSADKF